MTDYSLGEDIDVTVEEPTAPVWEAVDIARGLLAVDDWASEFDTGVRALAEPLR